MVRSQADSWLFVLASAHYCLLTDTSVGRNDRPSARLCVDKTSLAVVANTVREDVAALARSNSHTLTALDADIVRRRDGVRKYDGTRCRPEIVLKVMIRPSRQNSDRTLSSGPRLRGRCRGDEKRFCLTIAKSPGAWTRPMLSRQINAGGRLALLIGACVAIVWSFETLNRAIEDTLISTMLILVVALHMLPLGLPRRPTP